MSFLREGREETVRMRRRQKLDLHKNTDEQLGSIAEDRQVLRDKKKKK